MDAAVRDEKEVLRPSQYVQKFIADMNAVGWPHCFRTDNGGEFNSRSYVDYCDSAGIHREYTTPGKPQQNAVVPPPQFASLPLAAAQPRSHTEPQRISGRTHSKTG